jgi:predicted nucleic acid-binding protein
MGLATELKGKRVYLDANIFIYALNGFAPYAAAITELFTAIDAGEVVAVTSELTVAAFS